MSTSFKELKSRPYKRWYQFGWRSPVILYKRFQSTHYWIGRPIFRAKMSWQRVVRGYSEEDCWGLDHHLARVIVGGVRNLRKWQTGYPSEVGSWEEWDKILAQIETGFQLYLDDHGWWDKESVEHKQYDQAMALFAKWFGGLWD